MACRWFAECLLKILNFLLTLAGLGMVGYGIYLMVKWEQDSVEINSVIPATPNEGEVLRLGRRLLFLGPLSTSFLDKLPKAWFIYLFIAVGVILFIIACSGCIAVTTRRGCCLCCYTVLVVLLIMVELALAGFLFFDHKWEKVIPTDETGDFDNIKDFLEKHVKIVRWVALGVVILQVFAVILALVVRAANRGPAEYDSDDEYIATRPGSIRQPLINRQGAQVATVTAPGSEPRTSRNDAWSTRMREKYGLDTSEFTYNPTDSNRYAQPAPPPPEEKSRCTIM